MTIRRWSPVNISVFYYGADGRTARAALLQCRKYIGGDGARFHRGKAFGDHARDDVTSPVLVTTGRRSSRSYLLTGSKMWSPAAGRRVPVTAAGHRADSSATSLHRRPLMLFAARSRLRRNSHGEYVGVRRKMLGARRRPGRRFPVGDRRSHGGRYWSRSRSHIQFPPGYLRRRMPCKSTPPRLPVAGVPADVLLNRQREPSFSFVKRLQRPTVVPAPTLIIRASSPRERFSPDDSQLSAPHGKSKPPPIF